MQDAVIVSAVRTAVGKAPKGTLSVMRPDELAAMAIKGALDRAPQLEAAAIDDVILGCAMPEGEQGLNVARIASLRAGIPVEASAVTVNRFCSSGLQAIAYGAERIMLGQGRAAVAGGTESMSMVPMGGNKVSPNPQLVSSYPDVYLSTGLVAENHARDVMALGAVRLAAAEDDVLHLLGIELRHLAEGVLDAVGGEVGRQRHIERAALRLRERRAGAGDDDGFPHGGSFRAGGWGR